MYFVYLLLCRDGSLYTGISTDPKKRFKRHLSGQGGAYTRSHPPVKLVYIEPWPNRSLALKREAEIKSWPRQKKLSELKLSIPHSAQN